MQMSAEEIVRHYQQAKNKSADIGVLADLNSTDKASIRAVLADAGVEAILSALPAGADEDTRVCAFDLCMRLLRGALLTRLGVDR